MYNLTLNLLLVLYSKIYIQKEKKIKKYYLVVNGCGFSPVFSSNGYEVSLDPFL